MMNDEFSKYKIIPGGHLMTKMKIAIFFVTLFVLHNISFGQAAQAGVPFLQLAPDSRFSALGESGAGLADNSAASFWNPSGAAFLDGSEVSVTHSNWLPQFHLDLFYDYLTYRAYIPELNGNILSSITFMNYGQFVRTTEQGPDAVGTFNAFDLAVTVGYATKVSDDWGLGMNFRLIHSHLSDQGAGNEQGSGVATTVSVDLSAMWRPSDLDIDFLGIDLSKKLSIGANLSNVGPKIFYIDKAQADPIPTNFRLGFACNVYEDDFSSLLYTLDFSKLLVSEQSSGVGTADWYRAVFTSWGDKSLRDELKEVISSTGLEFWYGQPGDFLFAVRSGFFYEDPSNGNRKFLTFGAGIRYDIYGFDFSYISTSVFKDRENDPLANTLRFTLSVGWGGKPEKGIPHGI
jgi:hypothetical protein